MSESEVSSPNPKESNVSSFIYKVIGFVIVVWFSFTIGTNVSPAAGAIAFVLLIIIGQLCSLVSAQAANIKSLNIVTIEHNKQIKMILESMDSVGEALELQGEINAMHGAYLEEKLNE